LVGDSGFDETGAGFRGFVFVRLEDPLEDAVVLLNWGELPLIKGGDLFVWKAV
jgi:hypothetical protein